MEFIKELLGFLKTRKKFWMIPLITILLLFGALIVIAAGSALGPILYSLF
jgi:hypothetical protein